MVAAAMYDMPPNLTLKQHGDVIKCKHFSCYWPFLKGIYRWPVDSTHKGKWRGALMLSLICAWTNGWANNRDAGDLRGHGAHFDVTVMKILQNLVLSWMISKILNRLETLMADINISDVTMGAIAAQITSVTIVYSAAYLNADQRKHQSSASLAHVRGMHR